MKIRGWKIVPISPKANFTQNTECPFSLRPTLTVSYWTGLDPLQYFCDHYRLKLHWRFLYHGSPARHNTSIPLYSHNWSCFTKLG